MYDNDSLLIKYNKILQFYNTEKNVLENDYEDRNASIKILKE